MESLTVVPTLVAGRLEYVDSPLVQALRFGRKLVIDELDAVERGATLREISIIYTKRSHGGARKTSVTFVCDSVSAATGWIGLLHGVKRLEEAGVQVDVELRARLKRAFFTATADENMRTVGQLSFLARLNLKLTEAQVTSTQHGRPRAASARVSCGAC